MDQATGQSRGAVCIGFDERSGAQGAIPGGGGPKPPGPSQATSAQLPASQNGTERNGTETWPGTPSCTAGQLAGSDAPCSPGRRLRLCPGGAHRITSGLSRSASQAMRLWADASAPSALVRVPAGTPLAGVWPLCRSRRRQSDGHVSTNQCEGFGSVAVTNCGEAATAT